MSLTANGPVKSGRENERPARDRETNGENEQQEERERETGKLGVRETERWTEAETLHTCKAFMAIKTLHTV